MELQILYLDTLFFINLALDFLSLVLVGLLLHLKRSTLRLLLSSSLGALYATLAVLFSIHPVIHIFLSLTFSLLLVSLAYRGFGSGVRFFGAVLGFYLACVLLGGAVEALFTVLEGILFVRDDATLRTGDVVLLLGFLAFGLIYAAERFFGDSPLKKVATVRIRFGEKALTLPLLVDSGCLLSDPISGKAALLVRLEALGDILPSEIITCARSKSAYMPRDPASARRCRLIPAQSLDGRRLLLSVRADELSLLPEKKGKGSETVLDAYIALYSVEKARFGGFDGLFPSSLLHK